MRRGEVWYVRSSDSYGTEMALGRPALIVSSDYGAEVATHVQVLWCTTSPKSPCVVLVDEMYQNYRETYAIYTQLVTIDKRRVSEKIGRMSDEGMREIDNGLMKVLGLDNMISEVGPEDESVIENLKNEIENLKLEIAIGNRMYEKALDKLAECRIENKLQKSEPAPVVITEPEQTKRGRKPKVEESGLNVDIEDLKRNMSTPKEDPDEDIKRIMRDRVAKIVGKANVNTDSAEAIVAATGMSEQTAKEIVYGRKKYGGYDKLEDLLVVPRFGKGCLKRYGEKLTV